MSSRRRWAVLGVTMACAAACATTAIATTTATTAEATPSHGRGDAPTAPPSGRHDRRLTSMPVDVRPVEFDFVPAAVDVERAGDPVGDRSPHDRSPHDRSAHDRSPRGIPEQAPVLGSEVTITNAAAWHAAGYTGTGVRVGVIDFFDVTRYWNVAEHGPLPVRNVTARCFDDGIDCTETLFDGYDEGGDDHGVAVVEVIRDMAPHAEVFIGTAITADDYRRIIDWFHANDVTVLNRSLGARYDGPGDGRGVLDDIADYANSLGILWVNSGGNNGFDRYYRQPVRLIGDRVAFGPTGDMVALPFNGCVSLGGVRWANDWDRPPAERTDYDVYLWETKSSSPELDRLVTASEGDQRAGDVPIEVFPGQYCPSMSTRRLALEIRWRGGDTAGDVIEILDYGQGIAAFTQAAYSASTPIGDSRADGVLAVGAVDPPDSGTIGYYSSQGPTNDGRLAPDLVAPAGFASTVFTSGFSGTSAGAPVVAGGAALVRQAGLALDAPGLGNLLRHLTVDRGALGPDNAYGAGEFRLPDPPPPPRAVPSRFEPVAAPVRVLDTRPDSRVGPAATIGLVGAGEILDLPLADAIPEDATAVAVNLTFTQSDRPSFAQALPTLGAPIGQFSNLNVDAAGETRSNFAIVQVSPSRSLSIYSSGGGHVVVDLLGWFREAPAAVAAGRFVTLRDPQRVLDTRTGAGTPLASGQTRALPLPPSIDPSNVAALVITVTATAATGPGWLQAHPAGDPDVVGRTSTLNIDTGTTVANTAIVPVGASGAAVSGFVVGDGSTHVVVDVVGYITSEMAASSTDGLFVAVRPGRAYDSRAVQELRSGSAVVVDADAAPGSTVPPTASGVMWNVAYVLVRRPGFGRMWADAAPEPPTSAFNFSVTSEVRATAVISAVDDARARLMVSDGVATSRDPLAHVVADVFGYFT